MMLTINAKSCAAFLMSYPTTANKKTNSYQTNFHNKTYQTKTSQNPP